MAIGKFHRLEGSAPQPKVSVLVPSYNHERFLPEAIASILEQDFPAFEIIISDDASSDGSASIISNFAKRDPRVSFTVQTSHLGLVANCNWCLSQAKAEYVKFLFDDDKFARPDALGRLVARLEQDPRVVLASSAALVINQRSQVEFVRDYLRRDRLEEGWRTCRRCLRSGVNQIGEPSLFLFRRRCAGNGFNPAYRHWVDVEFALQILEQGWFAYLAEPLVAFRFHEGQQSRSDHANHLHQTEFYRLLVDCADRPWLGRKVARERLFEELCLMQNQTDTVPRKALSEALDRLGRDGYREFRLRRTLLRPLKHLQRSLTKRLYGHPA